VSWEVIALWTNNGEGSIVGTFAHYLNIIGMVQKLVVNMDPVVTHNVSQLAAVIHPHAALETAMFVIIW